MRFRIGQRVRMLHDSGQGVITALIDNNNVEVDLGDDFPVEVHISEIVAIDRAEGMLKPVEDVIEEDKPDTRSSTPNTLGISIFELSMALVLEDDADKYSLYLINPEPVDILYTSYTRQKQRYVAMDAGKVSSGDLRLLFSVSADQLAQVKGFYFQILSFRLGKGHPHQPAIKELKWNKGQLLEKPRQVEALHKKGWIYSLRIEEESTIEKLLEKEGVTVKITDKSPRAHKLVDLHIEELVPNPHQLSPSEMLQIQVQRTMLAVSQALAENYASLVLIHGVGEGTLRKEVLKILEHTPHVKKFEAADPTKFGNGATIAYFK